MLHSSRHLLVVFDHVTDQQVFLVILDSDTYPKNVFRIPKFIKTFGNKQMLNCDKSNGAREITSVEYRIKLCTP